MHSLEEIREEYDRLDKICGVDTSKVELVISNRGVKRLGSFRYPINGNTAPLRISINRRLFDEDEKFWDTVRHEYAHAVAYLRYPGERHGHDEVWKGICREIGCNPERLAAMDEDTKEAVEQGAKYRVHCKGCGRDYYYMREGKVIKAILNGKAKVRCPGCGGTDFIVYERKRA
jgi:predicted SprT family Zn-dependent metalloprotease